MPRDQQKTRVLVVDDSAFMRRAITRMLESEPRVEIAGTARNGKEGVEAVRTLGPDVVTLDIEMPEMDGLTALRLIRRDSGARVLMLSSLTTEGSHAALRAMTLGADDVMAKDCSQVSLSITNIQDDLVARVLALGAAGPRKTEPTPSARTEPATPPPKLMRSMFDLICIGSSTGGPPVLETIVKALPAGLTIPVVIAQHMPRMFTASMAERLDGMGALPVRHAEDRMPIEAGTVYVASGDAHTSIEKRGPGRACLRVGPKPTDALYRPSVDVLFTTAADACGPRVLAVILTGMGHDGFEGGKHLHEVGGKIIAQSAESCVVYGMPKAITESGIASASLPPSDIAATLASLGSAPLRASA